MATDQLPGSFRIQQELCVFSLTDAIVHHGSIAVGAGPIDITTPAQEWAYAVRFPFRHKPGREHLVVRIRAAVRRGRVGIGCIATDLESYITREVELAPEDGQTVAELHLEPGSAEELGWLVIRNVDPSGEPARITVLAIQTFLIDPFRSPDLVENEPPTMTNLAGLHASPREGPKRRVDFAARFQVLLTHASREWCREKGTLEYLRQRYADPRRLHQLPRFEELRPASKYRIYTGALTIGDLDIENDRAQLTLRRSIDSPHKIQHANLVGTKLVLCFEDFLAVLPSIDEPIDDIHLQPGSPWRIDDAWFAGLHTVFPVNRDVCIVSSSGADAVLWVDLNERKVIRRWRLPQTIYGFNYALTPEMSVVDHFIHNDIQLGHLNCAYPDNRGGCYISTLIQGDIGHVDEQGRYTLLSRGHIGCHGVRLARNGRAVYFSDSCGGRLMRIGPDGPAKELQSVETAWLHDAEQLTYDIYSFCLSDKNEVAFIDVASSHVLGRYSLASRGATVQFAAAIRKMDRT
jgi:hypothetical protein